MKRLSPVLLLVGVLLLPLLVSCARDHSNRDKAIHVEEDDLEMVAAIARARHTLPKFWQAFERRAQGESDFALKVEVTDKNGTEHFWATQIEREDGRIAGTIDNDPNIVRNVKLGDRIQINEADISDWFYLRGEKMVGNYTLRVLLKQMPPEEVDHYKNKLVDPD